MGGIDAYTPDKLHDPRRPRADGADRVLYRTRGSTRSIRGSGRPRPRSACATAAAVGDESSSPPASPKTRSRRDALIEKFVSLARESVARGADDRWPRRDPDARHAVRRPARSPGRRRCAASATIYWLSCRRGRQKVALAQETYSSSSRRRRGMRRSLASASASIWRMRSRLTPSSSPTSPSVRS